MKYSVPATFAVNADSAVSAEAKLKDLFDAKGIKDYSIFSPSGSTEEKPALSEEMATFFNSEIRNNDDDTSGHETDLDYVKGTLAQIPDEELVESCQYGGDLPLEDFAKHLNEEFDAIYAKYGGGTIVADLLPDD